MSLRQNALLLAVLTALIAIIGAWSGDPALAGAWRWPLALLLLGLAYEGWLLSRAHLTLTLRVDDAVVLGRTSLLRANLTHSLQRTLSVELAPDGPAAVEVAGDVQLLEVPPAGMAPSAEVAPSAALARRAGQGSGTGLAVREEPGITLLRIVPRRLGEHRWPAMRIRIGGPLGLAWWTRRLATDFKLQVVPELLRDDARRLGAATVGARTRAAPGAGAEILQLRDYRRGDPQHSIDWKATARRGRPISREFSEDQHLEIVIAIDAGRGSALRAGDLDRLGHYANLAARFAEHAVAADDRVGLILFADRPLATVAPGRGVATVMRIRRLLAASQLAPAESNPLNAALHIRTLARQRCLIVLLTDLDDATVAGQLASAARLLLPKHLPLIAGLISPAAEQLAHAPARSWLDPYESLAAQEYGARLRRNVQALHALGAPAVLARPDQLERAVFHAYAEFRQRRRV